jgi:hypothetical protein
MNKRLIELACRTLTRFDQDMDGSMEPEKLGDWIRYDDLEKFAELIIKEVLAVQEQLIAEDHNDWHLNKPTREHFGVE